MSLIAHSWAFKLFQLNLFLPSPSRMLVQMSACSKVFKEDALLFRESAYLDTLSLIANPVV